MADLVTRVSALATRIAQEFNSVRSEILASGGGVSGSCTVDVPAGAVGNYGVYEHRETVTLAGIVPTSKVMIGLAPHLDDDENAGDMLSIEAMSAIPATGSFDVVLAFRELTRGQIKLIYTVT